jgi:hypothetical protein
MRSHGLRPARSRSKSQPPVRNSGVATVEARPQPIARPAGMRLTAPAICVGSGLVLAFLALYVQTAARSIVVGDNPELVTTAVTLGVAHPPGYPLLLLLGHLFSFLPVEPVPFRLNLLAGMCGAATVALVYLSAWRLSQSWPAAALAAAALGTNPLFWSWSLAFEAFGLNNVLAATLIYLMVLWQHQPERSAYLVAGAFVGGLGLANHQTIVLIAPAVLCLTWRGFLRRPRLIAACLAAMGAGMLPYAYIPWAAARHPFLNWGDVASVQDFVALVSRADYGTGQLVSAEHFRGGSPVDRLLALTVSFSPIEAPLLMLGGVEAYRQSRAYFRFFLTAFVVAGPAFVAYANMDLSKETALFILERFFLLSHVAAAPVMALGAILLARLFSGVAGKRLAYPALTLGSLAALVILVVAEYRRVDQSHNYIAEGYAHQVLDSLPPGALLFAAADEHCFPLAYAQTVEGKRRDVTLVLSGLLPGRWYIRHLHARSPDLRLLPDVQSGLFSVKSLIEANRNRYIATVGPIDQSLKTSYGLIPQGLLSLPQPLGKSLDFVDIVEKNEALLRQYQIPPSERINRHTYELFLLRAYARPAEWIATQYRQLGHNEEAAAWYRRTIAIDPDYPTVRESLAQVSGK